jgi:peptide/nickel transport system permease protein
MHLWRFLGRRLALAAVSVFGIVVVAFLVAHMVPADPLAIVLSDQATKDPSIRAAYVKRWGLDRSLPEQFVHYLLNVLRGDLGESFSSRRPVLRDLAQHLPATIELALAALAFSVLVGIPLGIFAAVRHNRVPDHAARVISLVGAASPIFWTGLLALYLFYYRLNWFPGPGRLDPYLQYPPAVTGFILVDSVLAGNAETFHSACGTSCFPPWCSAGSSWGSSPGRHGRRSSRSSRPTMSARRGRRGSASGRWWGGTPCATP